MKIKMEFDRTVVAFFALFLTVYFLESIGGFYMTSAIVSIEKQFQIPSKISGMMVSAGDFGYIPSVVFVSYLGSKGNRSKWIGGGCILISIANLLIGSSHFLFPAETLNLDTSMLEASLERDTRRLPNNITFSQFLREISFEEQTAAIKKVYDFGTVVPAEHIVKTMTNVTKIDWLSKFSRCETEIRENGDLACLAFYGFLKTHNPATMDSVAQLKTLTTTSYAFCDKVLNRVREMVKNLRCLNRLSNIGPTVTIFLGLFILGIGRTMPFSLGLPLVDDNVKKSNLPLYFALMFFIRIMGPLTGFQMGAFFNKMYYTSEVPAGITPRDPMWIGRWWGGFLTIGGILLIPSLALFFFRAPDINEEEEENVENSAEKVNNNSNGVVKKPRRKGLVLVDRHLERGVDGKGVMPDGVKAKVEEFLSTISTVVKQPIYRWAVIGRIIDVFAFKGFYIFLPKFLEIQFGIPQYKVNQLMGIVGIISFACGIILGALAMKLLRLQGRRASTWVAVTGAIAASFSFINANIGCKSTMSSLGETISINFNANATCLIGCQCDSAPLYPVCDHQDNVFYSPCHAGCQLNYEQMFSLEPDKTPIFNNCGCAQGLEVSRQFCKNGDCTFKLYLHFAISAIGGIISGMYQMGMIPGILIMLRSVPAKHRSVSLGFNGLLVSLLATFPSPIFWGAIVDKFCIFWNHKCGERGTCALYATDDLRFWLYYTYGTLRMISVITDIFVVVNSKNLKLMDTEEDEENDTEKGVESSDNNSVPKMRSPEESDRKEEFEVEPFFDVANIKRTATDVEDFEEEEKIGLPPKSSSLPRNFTRNRRLSQGLLKEIDVFRKSSNYLPGPINEI